MHAACSPHFPQNGGMSWKWHFVISTHFHGNWWFPPTKLHFPRLFPIGGWNSVNSHQKLIRAIVLRLENIAEIDVFHIPPGRKLLFCIQNTYFREKNLRTKFSFGEIIEVYQKSFRCKSHWFCIGICNVSWFLRIWVFPSRANVEFHITSFNVRYGRK